MEEMAITDVIQNASNSQENEFYNPIPEGYQIGKSKYVIIYGTVMSGLGKGIFASSLAKLFQLKGLNVNIMKFDGYLNVDAGTLNPYRHGEVFVLDDGTESDMDLGTYERFLGFNMTKNNYLTGGKLFNHILSSERKGDFLGKDVQFVPHVTGEIKKFIRNLSMTSNSDVVFVEVGGTVGDIENNYFIKAMQELQYEEGKENVCVVALTFVLEPGFLGEQKSKAAQLGIRMAMAEGLNPDIIACRCHNKVLEKVREKISISSNVPINRVISIHDCDSIYLIPELIEQEKLDEQAINLLGLGSRLKEDPQATTLWKDFVENIKSPEINKELIIGITGKYTSLRDSYASIVKALEHAATDLGVKAKLQWIDTSELDGESIENELKHVDGIIVPGGFGSRGSEGKITCIKYARENKLPYLGLCYGFQMALVEYARNVLNLEDAYSTEIKNSCKNPVIDILPQQKNVEKMGASMRLGGRDVEILSGSYAENLYSTNLTRERFRHRWECNPDYIEQFEKSGLIFSGKAPSQNIMQILELPRSQHPFFLGTQFHPEYTSRPLKPHPLYLGFIKSILGLKKETKIVIK
jgi:CTP synthase